MKITKLKVLGATILAMSLFSSINANASEVSVNDQLKLVEKVDTDFKIKIALLLGGILAVTGLSFVAILKEDKEVEKMDIDLSSVKKGRKI